MSISLTSKYCLKRILCLLLDEKTVERKPFVLPETVGLFTKKANANKTEVRKIAI